jgi:hypothetical protein
LGLKEAASDFASLLLHNLILDPLIKPMEQAPWVVEVLKVLPGLSLTVLVEAVEARPAVNDGYG